MKKEIFINIVCALLLVASLNQIVPYSFLESENAKVVFVEIDLDLETEKETEKETEDQKEKEDQKDKITPTLLAYKMKRNEVKSSFQFSDTPLSSSQQSIVLPPPESRS